MSKAAQVPPVKRSPTEFFRALLGRPVIVKLYSGVTYHGILACMDGYMNIAMEQTQESVGGILKNSYADTFIRGNNSTSIKREMKNFSKANRPQEESNDRVMLFYPGLNLF